MMVEKPKPSSRPLRACLYAAVSTDAQGREDRYSIPEQFDMAERAAEQHGWTVAERHVVRHSRSYDWLHQLVRSSPEYARLIDLIETHQMDVLVCYDYDRLWRTDHLRSEVELICRESGVHIYSITQPVEPGQDSIASRIMSAFSGHLAAYEVERTRRRSMAGKHAKVAKGLEAATSQIPYGYRRIARGQPLAVFEPEARWVRYMYEQRTKGKSVFAICQDLTQQGIRTRLGKRFWRSAVTRILTNPFYVGRVIWHGDDYPGQHEPIITRELWGAVQRINAARVRDYHHPSQGHYLLTGFLRCGFCGDAMVYNRSRRYMVCGRYSRSRAQDCQINTHKADVVEAYVLDAVRRVLLDPSAFLAALQSEADNSESHSLIKALQAERASAQDRLARLLDAIESGEFPMPELGERSRTLRSRLRDLDVQIAALQTRDHAAAEFEAAALSMEDVLPVLDGLDVATMRQLLRLLIRRVILRKDQDPTIEWLV